MNTTSSNNSSFSEITGIFYGGITGVYNNGSGNISGGDYVLQYEMQETDKVDEFLYKFVCPVFVGIGILGNALSCYALCKPPLNNFASSVYLMAYGVSAMLCLSMSIGVQWSFDMVEVPHFQTFNESSCRIWQFLSRVITYSGEWFIVGSAIDRFIALWVPHKAQDMCTVFMAKASIVFTITGLIVVSIHAMWMAGLDYDIYHGSYHCWVNFTLDRCTFLWVWISGLLYGLFPQALIFIFGNLLIFRMCLKHRGRQIPETVSVETDLTHSVVILIFLDFFVSVPATILNIYHIVTPPVKRDLKSYYLERMTHYANYFSWFSYVCLFFILIGCSKPFRENIKGLFMKCRSGAAIVELQMLTSDYDEVPSSSTIL